MIYQSKASPFCIGSLLYISGDADNISLLTFHNLNQSWQPQRTRLWRFLTGTSHWTLEIAAWQGGTPGHKMKEWNSSGWSEKYGLDINRKYAHARWYRLKQRVFQYGKCLLAALHLRFIYSCWLLAPSQVSGLPNLGDGLALQMTGTKVARFVFSWHTHMLSPTVFPLQLRKQSAPCLSSSKLMATADLMQVLVISLAQTSIRSICTSWAK